MVPFSRKSRIKVCRMNKYRLFVFHKINSIATAPELWSKFVWSLFRHPFRGFFCYSMREKICNINLSSHVWICKLTHFSIRYPLLNSFKPKSVIFKHQRASTRQLLVRRLPCHAISLSCRKIMPLIASNTSDDINISSSFKSWLVNKCSRLPRAQYDVTIKILDVSSVTPMNVVRFSWRSFWFVVVKKKIN